MGKSKPRNRNKNRADPKAKPIKPPSDPELAAIRENKILPIIQDLQSSELKTRSAAAIAIANIIEDTKCRKLLLREQIVTILLEQTLTDTSLDAKAAGWGILKNLALVEEADFCVHLYRRDILTAIGGIVKNITETLKLEETPFSNLPKPSQELLWDLTNSVLGLVTSLSEAQDEIVDAISKEAEIIEFLFTVLSVHIEASQQVQSEALSSLTALSENNKSLCEEITDSDYFLGVLVRIKNSSGFRAVAACGVLHNIFTSLQWFDHNTPKDGASDSMLIPVLVSSIEQASNQRNSMNGHDSSSPDEILQLALEITASIATSLQEALEHGSKFEKTFEGFDDSDTVKIEDDDEMVDDEDVDVGEEQEDEEDAEMNDDDIAEDMELILGDEPNDDDSPIEEQTLDRLVREAAPRVLLLTLPSKTSSPEQDSMQLHALATLSNISWTVSSIDFSSGHLKSLQNFWSSLAQRIWNDVICPVLASNTADIELASAITSLAWAICRGVPGAIQPKSEEQRKFMALYQASKALPGPETNEAKNGAADESADAFQGLGVKSIGVLGRLALHPAPIELNRDIGVFLITVLSGIPETPAADVVEALNQIFDIYADKSYAFDGAVFWSDGFYDHLEGILPKAKKMAKGIDKRKFEELRARADEAVMNLGRFLRYKRNEQKQKD